MTDDEFWSATDQLKLIYRWARASYVAPKALLVAVLLRVIVSTGPSVMLPGPPAPASLNMGVVLVGRSGAGKGVTDKLSRVVWPADIHEEGLGSGQGIHELFKEQKDPEDRITRALITVSEIDHLAALNAGQGNNTRAAMKAALTGDRLGSKGATAATTRAVPADSYRLGLSISAQYGHCGVLLDDVSGGTPQRMAWTSVTDPNMPKELGPTPDRVLDSALPSWAHSDGQVLIQYGPPEIREYVNTGLWDSGRGAVAAIDGHRTLTRLKVAAALAILDHRSVISMVDWELSETIMAWSDDTRNSVLEYDRQAAREKTRARAISRATVDEIIDERHGTTVRNRILRLLTNGPMPRGELRRAMGKQHYREAFDAVLPHLEKISQVIAIPGEKAQHYALNLEFTREPEFTPQNSSSNGVNQRFTGEPSATVTDLNSRRSEEAEGPRVPCRQWLDQHVEQLRAAGKTTTTSFALSEAGQVAGYREGAVRLATSNHPGMVTLGRKHKETTYSITGQGQHYTPATEWVHKYLNALPANTKIVDQDQFRAAAEAQNYTWPAARAALMKCGRVESMPARGNSRNDRTWTLIAPEREDDAS